MGSSPNGRYLWCIHSDDPRKKPNEEDEGEKRPHVQIFEILPSDKEGEVITLLEIELVDLVERCKTELPSNVESQYSSDI